MQVILIRIKNMKNIVFTLELFFVYLKNKSLVKTTKKKISEYQIEDIKEIFLNLLKKISSKIILLEIGNNFINIALAKSQKNNLYIKKVFRQSVPEQAFDK